MEGTEGEKLAAQDPWPSGALAVRPSSRNRKSLNHHQTRSRSTLPPAHPRPFCNRVGQPSGASGRRPPSFSALWTVSQASTGGLLVHADWLRPHEDTSAGLDPLLSFPSFSLRVALYMSGSPGGTLGGEGVPELFPTAVYPESAATWMQEHVAEVQSSVGGCRHVEVGCRSHTGTSSSGPCLVVDTLLPPRLRPLGALGLERGMSVPAPPAS